VNEEQSSTPFSSRAPGRRVRSAEAKVQAGRSSQNTVAEYDRTPAVESSPPATNSKGEK
jgi:hypothetical protein